MDIPNADEIKAASGGLEWLVGGGGVGASGWVLYFLYEKVFKRFEEFNKRINKIGDKQVKAFESINKFDDYITKDREAFLEFLNDYNQFKNKSDITLKKTDKIKLNLVDKFNDLKTGINIQEGRVVDLEKKERKNYEELRDMSSDNKIMDREIQYLRSDMSDIKDSLKELTRVVIELKEDIIKIATNKK